MPCYTPPHGYCEHSKGICHETDSIAKEHLDYLTNLLCKVLKEMEQATLTPLDPELLSWWKKHKDFDKERNKI